MCFLDDEGRLKFRVLFPDACLRAWSVLFSLKCYRQSSPVLTLIWKHVSNIRILLLVVLFVSKKICAEVPSVLRIVWNVL